MHISPTYQLALFDFDGTLSLIRSGWQQVMASMMAGILHTAAPDIPRKVLETEAQAFIAESNGRPTISQMAWLSEQVARHGGQAAAPGDYLEHYLARLGERINERLQAMACGKALAEAYMVPGAHAVLSALAARGCTLALVSGTQRNAVQAEAGALGIAHFFQAGIHGPEPHDGSFSKAAVFEYILHDTRIPARAAIAFGDGPAEIIAARTLGIYAIGVAFDEHHGRGLDLHKRDILLRAGANDIISAYG